MPDKKYLIDFPDAPDGSDVWEADKWERNKDAFMSEYKDSGVNVFELEDYNPEDVKESDQIMITFEDNLEGSDVWDSAKWERNKDAFMAENPTAKVQRVRYKDYWGEQATLNRERKAELMKPDAERNARLAELGYYDDMTGEANAYTQSEEGVPQFGPSIGLKPLSSVMSQSPVTGLTMYADPKVAEFFTDDTYADRQAEIARLDAEYEENPSVIAEREWRAKVAKEQAEYNNTLEARIRKDAEADGMGDAQRRQYKKMAPMLGMGNPMLTAQYSAMYADAELPNEQSANYASALNMMEKIKELEKVAEKGFGDATLDVSREKFDSWIQPALADYNKIGDILTNLSEKLKEQGLNLEEENLSEEVFDKYLSNDEKALIQAFFQYNSALQNAQADMSGWYKGGKIFAESIPFMLEFLATGGLYKAAGSAATKGMAGALKRWVLKAAKGTAQRTIRKGAALMLKNGIYALAGTAARTVVAPNTYTRMAEKSIEIEDGELHRVKNSFVGFFDSYVENLSEVSGGLIGKALGAPFRGVSLLGKTAKGASLASRLGQTSFAQWGKMLGNTKTAKALTGLYKSVMPKMKQLGFHGLPEEIGEEYIGNAIRAITIDPNALKDMHKDGNFGAMLIGFAPMTLLGVGGGAATLAAVNVQAAKYGEYMRNMLGSHYNGEQVDHMMGKILGAENSQQMQDAIDPMIEAIKKAQSAGKLSQKQAEAEIKSIYDYSEFVAKNKVLMFAKQTRDTELADEKKAQMQAEYGKYWQESPEGTQTVQTATLNDGRTVFVTSAPAADGKIAIVDANTKEIGFANVSDIATEEVDGKTQQKSQTYTMDAYINGEIANERKTSEQSRMDDERNAQIESLRSGIANGTKINLGTEGAPVEVIATGKTSKAGVEVVASTGETMTIGWEQVADALGKPIIVKTNQQIVDEQAAEIVRMAAERRAKSQPKGGTTQVAEQTSEEMSNAVAQEEKHIPMLPDGTVNESAFWQQNPEEYAKWNDEQNQDGGADTREQIAAEMSELETMLAEQQKAQQTSNPAARKEAKLRAGVIMKRMMRLNSLATQYEIGENRKKWENVIGARIVHIDNLEDLRRLGGEEAITASHNGARVRGFYKGGQAYMYIPGLVQSEEYDEVFIHEVLAHYGLRQMLGKDFDWVLQNVWEMMSEESRQRFMNYPGVKGIADIAKRQLAAADEYIAHIAERMDANELLNAEEKSIWQKIVDFIKSWFAKRRVDEETMTEERIQNLIRQSYSFLAERKGEELAPIIEPERTALSAVEQEYETLAQDLTPEEIKAVASNEFNASQNAYNSLVASEPTVNEGESAKDFIARKKAYREQVEAAKAELEAKQALMDEIAKREQLVQPQVEKITEETPSDPFMELAAGDISFSIKTEDGLQSNLREFITTKEGRETGWTEQDLENIIEETSALINAIHESSTGNEFYDAFAEKDPTIRVDWRDGVAKPTVTWTRANIDYKYDMSADLLCINNEGLETVLSSDKMIALMELFKPVKAGKENIVDENGKVVEKKMEVTFSSADYLELYNTLKDLGFVVPCKGCFDAAVRFKMLPSVATKFAEVVNSVIDERNRDPEAFDAKVRATAKEEKTISGLPTTAGDKLAAIRVGVAGDQLTEHVKWTQLMSAEGQTRMLSDWGGIFRAWQRTGAGRPKDKLLPEPYYGDIVSSHSTIIGAYGDKTPSFRDILVNAGTGLRRNSHSEFRPVLAIDEIQFMRDAFIKNLTVFKYMKELDDVRLFGQLGVKFNMSFFPEFVPGTKAAGLDKNGDYIASEESVGSREFPYIGEDGRKHYDGMKGWVEAQRYINKDVSLSSVIFSVPHLIKALTDVPTRSDKSGLWGSLIPYHASGATASQIKAQGLGSVRAIKAGSFMKEAFVDYDKGVTNFEDVQNDRFGEGWVILEGKKKGQAVTPGHKVEYANGTHYYNAERGVHLFSSGYILDAELPDGALLPDGKLNLTKEQREKIFHKFEVNYNDKVRELKTPYAYQDAADYYLEVLPQLGLIPRFDFAVPEDIFIEMCEAANVDPHHPKLGWKGKGHSWSPIDSEAYYSVFCDYGMTDPATGKYSPHMPVGYVNEEGQREFRLPENAVEVVREGLQRFTDIRRAENERIDEAIAEFAARSVAKGRIGQEAVDKVLSAAEGSDVRFSAITKKAERNHVNSVMGQCADQVNQGFDAWLDEAMVDEGSLYNILIEGHPYRVLVGEEGFTLYTEEGGREIVIGTYDDLESMHSAFKEDAVSRVSPKVLANIDSLPEEMLELKAVAVANGTYLKAPNGAPSKLMPSQWLLVRTKGFIDWFGDWINSPENASQVVDENGEPMLVFHGTSVEFTEFKSTKARFDNPLGKGFYFSNSLSEALFYANAHKSADKSVLLPCFLNVTNPLELDEVDEIEELEEGEIQPQHDGIMVRDANDFHEAVSSDIVVAFNSNQIKSADSFTYDDAGNVIPLSERFNPEKSDIRFSVRESSMDEMDSLFKEYNNDETLSALYDKVSALAHTMGLKIKFDNPWSNAAGTTVADKVKFNSMFMDSPYQPAEKKAHAILHELIHATTQYAIQAKKAGLLTEDMAEAVSQVESIYNEIKADPAFEGMKGVESVHEMVAELANPEFRAALKEKNLFQQIVDAIKRLLGIETGENALDNLSSTLDYILENFDADAYRKYVDVAQRNEGYIRFSIANENQAIFVSNAARAVEGIKMEKATPAQWLAMIEKNGGLKAGEDKWMGLSDWLKASDRKTLTKAEVLDFVNEHAIKIEETHYDAYAEEKVADAHAEMERILQDKFNAYRQEYYEQNEDEDLYGNPANDYAIERLREELGDEFPYAIEVTGAGDVYLTFPYEEDEDMRKWSDKLGVEYNPQAQIENIRLGYTTYGLTNKREIALVVPTIEAWGEDDMTHFGDAGEGRAVAWIRFGDTEVTVERSENTLELQKQYDKTAERFEKASTENFNLSKESNKAWEESGEFSWTDSRMPEEWQERKREVVAELREARIELDRLAMALRNKEGDVVKKVLVIDEIQSKRHQEGRERGYRVSDIEQWLSDNNVEVVESGEFYEFIKNGETDRRFSKGLMNYDIEKAKRLYVSGYNKSDIPDAPFEKNWYELAMKRILRYAAEEGYDVIAWTKGEQQAERYNLGKVYNEIEREDNPNIAGRTFSFSGGNYDKVTVNEDGVVVDSTIEEAKGKPLSGLVGKDLAVKMMSIENYDTIDGEDLRIGGEGMRGFYDKMLPAFMNKYGKKWGIKVSDITLPDLEEAGRVMHSVPVTEEMKASVMEGQVMFSAVQIDPAVREEMDRIAANAIIDGNYMLAPNGQPTKLTADQWAMVRTHNFISWFGDWINDPENASKVVDENGEPMVIYHGSGMSFTVFDKKKTDENNELGAGFYFTDNPDIADLYTRSGFSDNEERYAGRAREIFNAKGEERGRADEYKSVEHFDFVEDHLEGYGFLDEDVEADYEEAFEQAYEEMFSQKTVLPVFLNMRKPYMVEDISPYNARELAKQKDVDGFIDNEFSKRHEFLRRHAKNKDFSQFVVFNPSQIKSATETTGEFSESEDIRFSAIKTFDDIPDDWTDSEIQGKEAKRMQMSDVADEYFTNYVGSVIIPAPNKSLAEKIGSGNKEVLIKRGVFAKMAIGHSFTPSQSRDILSSSLYSPNLYGQSQKTTRPLNWVIIKTGVKNAATIIEVNETKDFLEVVSWYTLDERNLKRIERQAKREGGEILILDSEESLAASLSALPSDLSSESKVTNNFDSANESEEKVVADSNEADGTRFSVRTNPAPVKTQDVYKLMRLGEDGKLYPLFIGSAEAIELGVWYDADSPNLGDLTKLATGVHLVNNETGEAMSIEQFKAQHPEIAFKGKRPNVDAINWATANGMRWIEIEDKAEGQKRYGGEARSYFNLGINGSGQVGQFAMRPGWHAGSLPTMRQIGKGADKYLRDDSFVWVKGRVPADIDYQAEADANPDKDIPTHIPVDGYYMKATNANAAASQADRVGWYVAGSFIADEIISDEEARRVITEWNENHKDAQVKYDFRREGGMDFVPGVGMVETMLAPAKRAETVVAEGLNLTDQEFARLAGEIFAALPKTWRKGLTDKVGNILDMPKATMQTVTRLAEKEDWTQREKELAKDIRNLLMDIIDPSGIDMERPLTTKEALWMLYNALENSTDIISEAKRSVVAHNLGFDTKSMMLKEKVDDNIRYSVVQNGRIDAATDMYNYEANLWINRLAESWLDMNQSVIALQDALAEASGKPIESWEDVVLALNQLSSKSYADKKKYMRDFLQPLWDAVMDIVRNTDFKIEDIERYMMLKHGLERNEKFAKRDAKQFYKEMFDKVADRMKNTSHAEQVVALSEAKKRIADIDAQIATAKGKKLKELQEARERAVEEKEIAELVLRGDEKQNEQDLQDYYDNIDNGLNKKYWEFREKDYGGLTSMFQEKLHDVKRKDYKTEEAYQKALLASVKPKYDTVAKMESAAKDEVIDFEGMVPSYYDLWKKVNAATKEVLRHQHASGMITTEQYDAVRNMFKYYVPLRGFADNTAVDMYSYYMDNSAGGFAKPIIAAKGRKTKAESPLGWIGTMAESAIQQDNKNEAKMRLYYALMNRPETGVLSLSEMWYEFSHKDPATGKKVFVPACPPATGRVLTADEMRQHMDAWEQSMKAKQAIGEAYKREQGVNLGGSVIFQDTVQDAEHIIRVKVAGKDYSIIVNGNPRAAQAINGLLNPDANVGPVGRWYGELRRGMSSLMTSFSPLFWVANYQRDLLSSFMRTSESEGWGEAFKYLANRLQAWRVAKYVYAYDNGTMGDSYYERLYKEFAENGGITGYTVLTTNKEYEKLLEDYAKHVDQKVLNWIKNVWEKFMGFGEAIEQVSRFAAYITARESGKSIEDSVAAAKEVSVNFNRKGSAAPISLEELDKLRDRNGKPLNAPRKAMAIVLSAMPKGMKELYFFFNASIQALSSSAKLAKKSPGKAMAWAGMYMGLSVGLAFLNYLLAGDDDDNDYLDLPDYLRHSTALIKVSDDYYFKWSLPQEMRPFYATADILVSKAMGKMPHKAAWDVGRDMALAVSEWLPVNPFGTEDPILALVPDVAAPLAEIKANQNSFGGRIYNDMSFKSEAEAKQIPAYRKGTSKTGEIYVDMAEFLNDISGGDEVQKGWLNINPAIAEHLVEGYGGGIYDFAKMMIALPGLIASDEPLEVRDIPFVNKVILSTDETNMNSHVNEAFNHYKGIADNAKRVENEYRKSDDPARADDYMAEDDWRIYLLFRQYEEDLKMADEKVKDAVDDTEKDLAFQEQNVIREMLLNDIARGSRPSTETVIKVAVESIRKESNELLKPSREAEKKLDEAKKRRNEQAAQAAKREFDSLKDLPEYKKGMSLKKDLDKIKHNLDKLQYLSPGVQRDSVLDKVQRDYDALVKKARVE